MPSRIKKLNNTIEAINNYIEFKRLNRTFRHYDRAIRNPSSTSTDSDMIQFREERKRLFQEIEKYPPRMIHSDRELLQLISEVQFYRELLGQDELTLEQQNGTAPLLLLKTALPNLSGDELFSAMAQVPVGKVGEIIKSLPENWRESLEQTVSQKAANSTNLGGDYLELEQQFVAENRSSQKFDEVSLNKKVAEIVEDFLSKLDQEMLFEIYCTQFVSVDEQIPALNLTGAALSTLQEHTVELSKRVSAKVIDFVNRRFNTTEKVFKFVKDNWDPIGEKLSKDEKLRNAVFEKLDTLIEEEMLKELEPNFTEKHLPKASKFLSALGFEKRSEWAKSIRKHLEVSFKGMLSEEELRQFMSSRLASKKGLRLPNTAVKLSFDHIDAMYAKKNSQRRTMESIERYKRYTKILWEARNNKFDLDDAILIGRSLTGSQYFENKLEVFYDFTTQDDLREIFWDTILEDAKDCYDFDNIIRIHAETVQKDLNKGNISKNEAFLRRTLFLRKFPLRKYLEMNNIFLFGPQVMSRRGRREKSAILTMCVLLFIKSIKNHQIDDMVFASKKLKIFDIDEIQGYIQNAKKMSYLTADEFKTFEENFELPTQTISLTNEEVLVATPVQQQEDVIKDPFTELEERLNTFGLPLTSITAIIDEKALEEELELMDDLEALETLETVENGSHVYSEDVKETPEELLARLEQLPQPPTEAPYDVWLEFNKRLQALGVPVESESLNE